MSRTGVRLTTRVLDSAANSSHVAPGDTNHPFARFSGLWQNMRLDNKIEARDDHPAPEGDFMTIRIKARGGESAEQLMRRFKKMCEKEGLTKDIKRRMYYEKPSEKRQRAHRKSVKRAQQLEMVRAGLIVPSPRNSKGRY